MTSTRRRSRFAFASGALVAALVLAANVASWLAAPPVAAAVASGAAQVIKPVTATQGGTVPLGSGGSATAFSLALPGRAACAGDSATDGYRIQSFMVPSSVRPSSLQFGSAGPEPTASGGAFRRPLFATTSEPFVNVQTANADHPHDPGYIINIADFDLSVYKPGDVPPGVYTIGIACTKGPSSPGQLTSLWITTLTVTADPADKPAGVHWTATGGAMPAPATGATTPTSARATLASTSSGAAAEAPAPNGEPAAAVGPATAAAPAQPASTPGSADSGPPTESLVLITALHAVTLTSGSMWSIAVWAVVLLVCVRMAYLLSRPAQLRPA